MQKILFFFIVFACGALSAQIKLVMEDRFKVADSDYSMSVTIMPIDTGYYYRAARESSAFYGPDWVRSDRIHVQAGDTLIFQVFYKKRPIRFKSAVPINGYRIITYTTLNKRRDSLTYIVPAIYQECLPRGYSWTLFWFEPIDYKTNIVRESPCRSIDESPIYEAPWLPQKHFKAKMYLGNFIFEVEGKR